MDIFVHVPEALDLVLKLLYIAIFLAFAKDLEEQFAYAIGNIYGLIFYFLVFFLG
jgi:hypothetical protein